MTDSLYHVGDRVRVVDEPYRGGSFGWGIRMDKYCGRDAEIRYAHYYKTIKSWGYQLSFSSPDGLDEPMYIWCNDCLMPECKHEIAEVSHDDLKAIL